MHKLIRQFKSKLKELSNRPFLKKIKFKVINDDRTYKKIIFLLPNTKYPSGGTIVAHHHSDRINEISYKDFQSEIAYPNEPGFSPNTFVHQSIIKRNLCFDLRKDFVIIPEVMVLQLANELINSQIKFGIHVQNGYLMDLEMRIGVGGYTQLKEAYSKASLIIGNSEDTVANIKFVFPEYADKIIRSFFVIDKSKFQDISFKKNVITYMPRKLDSHSKKLLFFLGVRLPKNWTFRAIDGVSEQEVYNIFYESKIFLSFSEFEGLAMPPAMAAMCGNRVIGYTGEANKEYFHLPCFEEIPCGDIKLFATQLLNAIERFENGAEKIDLDSIKYLENLFSKERQEVFLMELINKVDLLMNQ